MMDHIELLEKLMNTFGCSGYERRVSDILKSELEKTADCIETDRMGNVLARYGGSDPYAPVVMVFAHLDQLGFIIRKITDDGFIQVDRLGGIPEAVLPGLNVCIRTKDDRLVYGVFGNKSHHAASPEDKYKVNPVTSQLIDIGVSDAAQVRQLGIEIGCPVTYRPFSQRLQNTMISGTAVDDRGGLVALAVAGSCIDKKSLKSTVYLVGTVWEEFNLRGAMLAARTIHPDITISLDVVLTGDTPDLAARYDTKCGYGPVVEMYSFHGRGTLNGTIPHEGLVRLAERTAAEENIPLQYFAGVGILTDSSYVQLEGHGTAALELGFPARYTHTPVETADTNDILQLGRLVSGILHRLDRNFDLNRY